MFWCIVREFFKKACVGLFQILVVVGGFLCLVAFLDCIFNRMGFLSHLADLIALLSFIVLFSTCLVIIPYAWVKRLLRDARRKCDIKWRHNGR
jgi:hypothetical protein